jgi:uncharacterized protein
MRHLIVLAKPPLRGRSKSRLARGVGEGRAARIARAMLKDTCLGAQAITDEDCQTTAHIALTDTLSSYPVLPPHLNTLQQGTGDLGQRLARLAAEAMATEEVDRVLLLGTDSPGLPPEHLRTALELLEHHDVVLGPVEDGGFWCLGLRASATPLRDPEWLNGLDWESGATAAMVTARAHSLDLSVTLAPSWFDIDHAEDLPRLKQRLRGEPTRSPSTLYELELESEPLSVIIANLNEGSRLESCLDDLASQAGLLEVIVADGGSADGSAFRAATRPGIHVCMTERGRGRQLAAGARLSTGERLLFLHVDVRLPPDGTHLIHAALDQPQVQAGAFVTRTQAEPGLRNFAGPLLRLADLRSRFTRHPYGDQALFMTREAYTASGGFRELPILEDYDLSRRLAARMPITRIKTPVTVSGRRIQQHPLRNALLLRLIPPLYHLGVNPDRLAHFYRPIADPSSKR